MKDDAVIKDNEAVYLLNEQTYLHLRENLQGVGYEVFDKSCPLPVEEGQIPREALGNTQRRIETARAYYLAEHQDEPVGRIQNVAVTTLEKFRSGVRKRRNLAPRSLPENDVRFMRLLSQRIPTENTFIITLSTTPLHWTAPENSGIFCCPGWRCSD